VILFLALTLVGETGARYDHAAKRLVAHGAAAADLRAPSATIARVKAERSARNQAEKKLSAALIELKLEPKTEELAALLANAQVENERFGSDGSVELDLSLSTAALPRGAH
jgi:hypothetical protein